MILIVFEFFRTDYFNIGIISWARMEYFDSLTEFNFDIKYMLILFNFVTIIFLVIYRKMNPTKIT